MEMGRRFLLVGAFVALPRPFHQGSVMQVAIANLVSIIYLVFQLQAAPYKKLFDNFLALGCSLIISIMLLCSTKGTHVTRISDHFCQGAHIRHCESHVQLLHLLQVHEPHRAA